MKKKQVTQKKTKKPDKPAYVQDLEAVFGPPSDSGFGGAVFFEQLESSDKLAQAALQVYQTFVGELWERWGAEVWMGPWKAVYTRPAEAEPAIVDEINAIEGRDAIISVPLLLDPDGAQDALAQAYNAADVAELLVYTIGDGDAMSGLLVAGRRDGNDAVFVVALMD